MKQSIFSVATLLALSVTLRATDAEWSPVGMRRADQTDSIRLGADGAQMVRALAVDGTTGDFMLWGTDVGGLFRSLNGGRSWEPANVGYNSRGCTGIAIDPRNPKRVLALGSNSSPSPYNGLYLSEDQAASWREVFRPSQPMANNSDERNQLVFDPASYDEKTHRSLVAYWSRAAVESAIWNKPAAYPAFYKSADGGITWVEVPEAKAMAGSWLAVHPTDGTVYAANASGLHISTDGGKVWKLTLEGDTTAVALCTAQPTLVYALQASTLQRSEDGGRTWQERPAVRSLHRGKGRLLNLAVAPSDPNRLVFYHHRGSYDTPRYVSHDGGMKWRESQIRHQQAFLPFNQRNGHFAFHPKNADIILSVGGDYPTLSTDGGLTYDWSADGVNNLVVGRSFNFSTIDPKIAFIGSQDYATMLTSDGGLTWRYSAPGRKRWGGFNYGAYASTPKTLVVGEAKDWGSPRLLAVSTDGGNRWRITNQAAESEAEIGYGHPTDPATLFWSSYRTVDAGRNWAKMSGVSGVFTHNPKDQSVWGVERGEPTDRIVKSRNFGATWEPVPGTDRPMITDIAVDPQSETIWVVQGDRLWSFADGNWRDRTPLLPRDQEGAPTVRSIALDPVRPEVIYAATGRNFFKSNVGPVRSVDGGNTWHSLLRQKPLDEQGKDGGNESHWVRVNPLTREAWFATSCYGIWKVAPPAPPGASGS